MKTCLLLLCALLFQVSGLVFGPEIYPDDIYETWGVDFPIDDDDLDLLGHSVSPLPNIDGAYVTDAVTIRRITSDQSNWVQNPPSIVAHPKNNRDVARVIEWCHDNFYPCTIRGLGHATYGESQALIKQTNIIITMRNLTAVVMRKPTSVVVQGGATYLDLINEIALNCVPFPMCSRFPKNRPLFVAMTIAGNLVIGGIGEQNFRLGYVAEQVLSLKVVNGQGEIIDATRTHNQEYFNGVLGGLGQIAATLEVEIATEPAPAAMVRVFSLVYGPNFNSMFADMMNRTKMQRWEGISTLVFPVPLNATALSFTYILQLSKFWTLIPPDNSTLLEGYSFISASFVDFTYYNWSVRNSVGLPNTAYMGNINSVIPSSNFSAWWLDGIARLSNAGNQFQIFFMNLIPINIGITTIPLIRSALPNEEFGILSDFLVITNHVQRLFWAEFFETKYKQLLEIGGHLYAYGTLNAVDYRRQFDTFGYNFLRFMKNESDPHCILNIARGTFSYVDHCNYQPYPPTDFTSTDLF